MTAGVVAVCVSVERVWSVFCDAVCDDDAMPAVELLAAVLTAAVLCVVVLCGAVLFCAVAVAACVAVLLLF